MERVTLPRVSRQSQMSLSRATVKEFDDKHLVQEIKEANGYYSETATNKGAPLERFQPVGVTAFPLKQFEDPKQKQQGSQQSDDGFNANQPKGKSAEAVMLYLNGSRSHPIAMVDDRRVRPYNAKEGDAMLYHASGTEQKVYLADSGAYLLANNNKSEEKDAQEKDRFASLRHVNLAKQKHEIKKDEQVQDHKHEGDSVNTEVRCDKDIINFFAPDGKKVGYYTKKDKKWLFDVNNAGNITLEMTESQITLKAFGSTIVMDASKIADTSENATRTASKDITDTGNTITLNLSESGGKPPALNLDGGGPKVMTVAGPAKYTGARVG